MMKMRYRIFYKLTLIDFNYYLSVTKTEYLKIRYFPTLLNINHLHLLIR